MSIYCKEFLFLHFALETFSHFIWGTEKPVLILSDNKSLTQFFRAKTVPPYLWNYVDRVTALNIVVTHISGKANATADFLSRLQSSPNETSKLKLTNRIAVRENEIDVQAKVPDNTINESFADNLPVVLLQVVDINRLIKLKQSGIYDQTVHQLKNLTPNCELQLTKYKKKTTEINATQHTNPMDDYPELEATKADLKKGQSLTRGDNKSEQLARKQFHTFSKHLLHRRRTEVPQTVSTTIYRKRNTSQKIFCPRWNNFVQTIMCTENNTKRSHVQNPQLSNWRTLGNYLNN